jgi:hypothetical protein
VRIREFSNYSQIRIESRDLLCFRRLRAKNRRAETLLKIRWLEIIHIRIIATEGKYVVHMYVFRLYIVMNNSSSGQYLDLR